jgi:hypothetical protein
LKHLLEIQNTVATATKYLKTGGPRKAPTMVLRSINAARTTTVITPTRNHIIPDT